MPAPTSMAGMPREQVLLAYLDHFRGTVVEAVAAMGPQVAGTSLLASGWTPLELARHLTYVERRWLEWGFVDPDLCDPWGDWADGHWHVPDGLGPDEVLEQLTARGERTRRIVQDLGLDATGDARSARWEGLAPTDVERVLLHLLQEYARHCGHLDVVVELTGGR